MDERYPIGEFQFEGELNTELVATWIKEIEILPSLVREAVKDLTDQQLDTPYRAGGWTLRQVVHHIADASMNSYIRFKLAVTESNPVIKPYDEAKWANLKDSTLPVESSLAIIEGVHARWFTLLQAFSLEDFQLSYVHPEGGEMKLGVFLGFCAWHGNHHLAHITTLVKNKGW
ncbi:YfiT family bacillithiol transferase [Bacillus timonensis]|uniref:YfiT family bacillithiol transferase n=1 Tax=Bacillus timonensis TaxID=1033734 RepID=UPI0002888DD7|nr:putative metal-dependent hydrolase [Bacillus timonensis]